MSAEYIMAGGNEQVILCERGIRTFETYTRNTLDISAVPVLKKLTHLPVVVGSQPRQPAIAALCESPWPSPQRPAVRTASSLRCITTPRTPYVRRRRSRSTPAAVPTTLPSGCGPPCALAVRGAASRWMSRLSALSAWDSSAAPWPRR